MNREIGQAQLMWRWGGVSETYGLIEVMIRVLTEWIIKRRAEEIASPPSPAVWQETRTNSFFFLISMYGHKVFCYSLCFYSYDIINRCVISLTVHSWRKVLTDRDRGSLLLFRRTQNDFFFLAESLISLVIYLIQYSTAIYMPYKF